MPTLQSPPARHDGQHEATRARAAALEAAYTRIAQTRMQGLPLLNVALRVQSVGFEPLPAGDDGDDDPAALGVLVTPWFMNLTWLPLARRIRPHCVGGKTLRRVGDERFEFIGMHEDAVGSFGACSLFSPMFEFTDHAAAVATAHAVLGTLRTQHREREARAAAERARAAASPVHAPPAPAARNFLTGRGIRHG